MSNDLSGRPNSLTPDMALAAATSVAENLMKSGDFDDRSVNELARDIAKHGKEYIDGYELAKALEDNEYWSCNLEIAAAILDAKCGEPVEEYLYVMYRDQFPRGTKTKPQPDEATP